MSLDEVGYEGALSVSELFGKVMVPDRPWVSS